jgi:hypothetical protein
MEGWGRLGMMRVMGSDFAAMNLYWRGLGGWKPPPQSIHYFGVHDLSFGLFRFVG